MEDYELHAPQWVDFTKTSSPIPAEDFFEKSHKIHERIEDLYDSISENIENAQPMSDIDVLYPSTQSQANLDVMKNIPVKVVSPKYRNNKIIVKETTYDQVLSDAMRKLEFCKKTPKSKDAVNKTMQESNVFKTPHTIKITKSSKSVGHHSVSNKSKQDSATKSAKLNKHNYVPNSNISTNVKKTLINHAAFKEDKNDTNNTDISKGPNVKDDSKDDEAKLIETKESNEKNNEEDEKDIKESNEKNNEEDEKDIKELSNAENEERNERDNKELQEKLSENNEEIEKKNNQDNIDAISEKEHRTQSINKHTVLTWHNHRRSLPKRKMSINNKKYVSLAEAVSRFQKDTPERFHTKSNKANVTMLNMSKVIQNRLKPTVPISPALISKTRTRPVTVLSREEREKLEAEEMKKYKIKANPIPRSVLRNSQVTTTMKKSTTVDNSAQSNEKICASNTPQFKTPLSRDKATSAPKNIVTKIVVNNPSGIVVEREQISFFGVPKDNVTKNVTRVMPFSFEARNKDLQMKKEQRLKSLQETNKTTQEFHARPVPNFPKTSTPFSKQELNAKKLVTPRPFSFDNRDKKMFEKKEQLVKQILEEDKRGRVFRANPVPVFKPVMVRGRSKEQLLAKKTSVTSRQVEDQENREPNVNFANVKKENNPRLKKAVGDEHKMPLKPFKLNTDKRAKERYEFNEKIKRKEMEEEAKRQEEEKKRLESEKEMRTRLRKLTEIKAKPMPTYKPPVIIKSTKMLINPQSPAFASKLRAKQRSQID